MAAIKLICFEAEKTINLLMTQFIQCSFHPFDVLYFRNMTVIIGHSNKSEPDVLILGHGNISLVHFSSEYQHIRIIFSKICDHTFHVRKLSTLLLFGKNVIISQKSNQSYHLSFLKKLCV